MYAWAVSTCRGNGSLLYASSTTLKTKFIYALRKITMCVVLAAWHFFSHSKKYKHDRCYIDTYGLFALTYAQANVMNHNIKRKRKNQRMQTQAQTHAH